MKPPHHPFLFVVLAAWLHPIHGARVYYVNQPENLAGQIVGVSPDGQGSAVVWASPVVTDLRGIATDMGRKELYFAHALQSLTTLSRTEVSLRRVPMAGGTPVVVTTFPDETFLADVEFDAAGDWVYQANSSTLQLLKLHPDGSGLTTVLTHTAAGSGPYFVGLDLVNQYAYWGIVTVTNETNTAFSRGTLAGVVDPTFSLVTTSRTRDIAIDVTVPGAPRVYWCDRQNGAVYTRPVAGGAVNTVRTGMNAPHGLAIDVEAGKGYVADTGKRGGGTQPSAHRVVRFNLDGTGALEFLSPVSAVAEPYDVALDLTSTSYADWKTRFWAFGAAGSAATDDPDGDGRPNAAEYALFSHPLKADSGAHTLGSTGSGVRFARRKIGDVPLRLEVSSDFTT